MKKFCCLVNAISVSHEIIFYRNKFREQIVLSVCVLHERVNVTGLLKITNN